MNTITYLTLVMSVSICLVAAHPLSIHGTSVESLDGVSKRDLTAESSAPDASKMAQVDTNDKFKYGDVVFSYGNGLGGYGPGNGFGMGMPAGYGGGFGAGMGTGVGGGGGYMPNPYYPSYPGRYDNFGNGMGNFYGRRY